MDFSLENIYVVVFLFIIAFIISVVLLNVYSILRNGFYVPVNCWFCNNNSKVLYALRNSFECPYCLQYNGFTKDGDYNKVIHAQHDSSQNLQSSNCHRNEIHVSHNSLCATCNNNLQLKIFQLANFTPLNEKKYGIEVEHFEKQLDKAYKLCPPCEKLLKRTIRRQNAWIFAKHLKDLQKKFYTARFKKSQGFLTKQLIVFTCIRIILLIFTCILILRVRHFDFKILHQYRKYIPSFFTVYLREIQNLYVSAQNAQFNFLDAHFRNYLTMLPVAITSLGVFLELILITFDTYPRLLKANELICWLVMSINSSSVIQGMPYVNVLQIICPIYFIFNHGYHIVKKQVVKNKFSFKKKKPTDVCDDLSDLEETVQTKSNIKRKKKTTKYKTANTAKNGLQETFNSTRTLNKSAFICNSSSDGFYSDSEEEFCDRTVESSESSGLSNSFRELRLGMKNGHMCSPSNSKVYSPVFKQKNQSFASQQCPNLFSKQNSPINSFSLPQQTFNGQYISPTRLFEQNSSIFKEMQRPLISPQSFHENFHHSKYYFGTSANNTFVSTQPKHAKNPLFLSSQGESNYTNLQDTVSQKSGITSPINMFRPVSPPNSVFSQRQCILSPPKLNTSTLFGFQNHPTLVYQSILFNDAFSQKGSIKNSSSEFLNKSNFFDMYNSFSPARASSRASSESSGFVSNNEFFKTASQSASRNPSPERNVRISSSINHFKID